jgi:hypothetical protein
MSFAAAELPGDPASELLEAELPTDLVPYSVTFTSTVFESPPILGFVLSTPVTARVVFLVGAPEARLHHLKKSWRGAMTVTATGRRPALAAINGLEITAVGECLPRRRHHEFLRFLRRSDGKLPPESGLDP